MTGRLPDFVIIGAMKCGTSSLHDRLGALPGFFMSEPKEPNFFSDDPVWERGLPWYCSLFAPASPTALCGESSTHYTKLPTHPAASGRLAATLPNAKLVYVMRNPVERLVSQYRHEWTRKEVREPFEVAVRLHSRFVDYSCYQMQLEPYLRAFGPHAVLPVFFERLVAFPAAELARVLGFLGAEAALAATRGSELPARNRAGERLRPSPLREALLRLPGAGLVQRALPTAFRERLKDFWRPPRQLDVPSELREELSERIDADLARLGGLLGARLSVAEWRSRVLAAPLEWVT